MTTVAYRDGVMASDSSCWDTEADVNSHNIRKVFRVKGLLVGCAGTISTWPHFLDWLRKGSISKFPRLDSFSALVVSKDGDVRSFDESGPLGIRLTAPYYAIGSGCGAALGAMFAGADAKTAVRAAIKHAEGTTGPVRVYRL